MSDEQKFSMSANFTTKVYRKGTYPYIYLRGSDRNTDRTLRPGFEDPSEDIQRHRCGRGPVVLRRLSGGG